MFVEPKYDTDILNFAERVFPNKRAMFLHGVVFVPSDSLISDMFIEAGIVNSRREYRQQKTTLDVIPLKYEGVLFLSKYKKRHLLTARYCILLDENDYEQRPKTYFRQVD